LAHEFCKVVELEEVSTELVELFGVADLVPEQTSENGLLQRIVPVDFGKGRHAMTM
jgi:hypothetical protein